MLEIARFTLFEAARRRLLLVGLGLIAGFLALYGLGFWQMHLQILERTRDPSESGRFLTAYLSLMTLLGMYVVTLIGTLLGLFTTMGSISGEIESGAMQAVLTKPLRRRDVLLGKLLSHGVLVSAYVTISAVGLLLVVQWISGYVPPSPLRAVGLMVWSALLMMVLSLAGSTVLPTISNGVVCFLLFGLGWLGGFVEALGTSLENRAMIQIGVVTSLFIPNDALWRAASYYLQPSTLLILQSSGGGASIPFASPAPPATAMLVWASLYLIALIVAAVAIFDRRDI